MAMRQFAVTVVEPLWICRPRRFSLFPRFVIDVSNRNRKIEILETLEGPLDWGIASEINFHSDLMAFLKKRLLEL